jgi:hypothetical protein
LVHSILSKYLPHKPNSGEQQEQRNHPKAYFVQTYDNDDISYKQDKTSVLFLHGAIVALKHLHSNINDGEVKNRISKLGKNNVTKEQDDFARFQKFLEWERSQRE